LLKSGIDLEATTCLPVTKLNHGICTVVGLSSMSTFTDDRLQNGSKMFVKITSIFAFMPLCEATITHHVNLWSHAMWGSFSFWPWMWSWGFCPHAALLCSCTIKNAKKSVPVKQNNKQTHH
jgi:hypothetical protein